jgi:hypothetical protein
MTLTSDQKQHLVRLFCQIEDRVDARYRAGAKEHGDCLTDKSPSFLLDAAIEEAVDQLVYLLTLKDALKSVGWR